MTPPSHESSLELEHERKLEACFSVARGGASAMPDSVEDPLDTVAFAMKHRIEAGAPASAILEGMFGAAPATSMLRPPIRAAALGRAPRVTAPCFLPGINTDANGESIYLA
jgi:hypothetical protein